MFSNYILSATNTLKAAPTNIYVYPQDCGWCIKREKENTIYPKNSRYFICAINMLNLRLFELRATFGPRDLDVEVFSSFAG